MVPTTTTVPAIATYKPRFESPNEGRANAGTGAGGTGRSLRGIVRIGGGGADPELGA
jgi:hypothetical protein